MALKNSAPVEHQTVIHLAGSNGKKDPFSWPAQIFGTRLFWVLTQFAKEVS